MMATNRSNAELGAAVYPGGQTEEAQRGPEAPDKPRTNAELGAILFPCHTEDTRFASPGGGGVEDVIRSVDGAIVHRGRYHGDLPALAGANSEALSRADLKGIDFAGKSLAGAHAREAVFHGDLEGASFREADLRGARIAGGSAKGADFCFADIRGLELGVGVSIAGANFTGAKLDADTYDHLAHCPGFEQARGLVRPVEG